MAAPLARARDVAAAARQRGQSVMDPAVLAGLITRYRAIGTAGLAASVYRRTTTAKDARRIARRFLASEDLIPHFAGPGHLHQQRRRAHDTAGEKCSSAALEDAGAPSKGSPASRLSSPTSQQPPDGPQQARHPPRPLQRVRLWLPPGLEPAG